MSSEVLMQEDLAKSGLIPDDMLARPLDAPERAMTMTNHSIAGYVIPYFDLRGKLLPHYRVRLFDATPKYKQPKDTPNHVYFPRGFHALSQTKPYIVITEGEKKASIATKLGFPTIGLGGVDNWRNRAFSIPSESELTQLKGGIKAHVPSGSEVSEDLQAALAIGIQELIDYAMQNKKQIIIAYDSDREVGVKPSVQRAAAALAFELRFRGIKFDHIRQIVLPPIGSVEKVGLDELLTSRDGSTKLAELIQEVLKRRSAFPRHPTIREFINRRLQKSKPNRKEVQQVSLAILSDLDANGIRLRSTQESQTFYFDFDSRKLLRADFNRKDQYDSSFGQFLYRNYGISTADQRLAEWLAAQFTGEDPVGDVSPHRILARISPNDDSVTYQLSDSQYARVDADGLEIYDNGANGILFESEQVEPLDTSKLLAEYRKAENTNPETLKPYWTDVLSTVRLRDQDKQRLITALLYYISPWLNRWRGTQLPAEMIIGEPGSGKSSLCELRLTILNGRPILRNAPQDLKDWHASISNSGGLHVTDNLQLVDRNLRQRLSDEICRIITEPNPTIEQRKYYTNADLVRIPVRAVFAFTSILQPFQNADIIQRTIITDFEKLERDAHGDPKPVDYDSLWVANQIARFGGREAWAAHHLFALHKFFKLVRSKWDVKYKAKHRLINLEQSMMIMAEVLGIDASWVPGYLSTVTDSAVIKADWVFEGIRAFCDQMGQFYHSTPIFANTISDWCEGQEDFVKNEILTNGRRLSNYLTSHKAMVAQITGLVESGSKNNRIYYKIAAKKVVPKKDHQKVVEKTF